MRTIRIVINHDWNAETQHHVWGIMDRFASMAVFAQVADTGSFASAATLAGMSPAMVAKHIQQLEEHLGVRLLNRTTRRQSLTDAGRDFLERTRIVLAELEAAEAMAADSRARPRGELRINAPAVFGAHSLSPVLPIYMAENPEVKVRLTLSDRVVDLVDEGYDCVFRVGALHDSTLIARSLRPLKLIACAAPAYLERAGQPQHPDDLAQHACLGFAGSALEERWTFCGSDGETVVSIKSRFSANSGDALRQAALAGMGVILHAQELLAPDVKEGRLIHVLPTWRSERPMHILHAPDRRITPKLRSFLDFAAKSFRA